MNTSNEQRKEKQDAHLNAIDGLLREVGRGGYADDNAFVARVMGQVAEGADGEKPIPETIPFTRKIQFAMGIAASVLVIGGLLIWGMSFAQLKTVEKPKKASCVLVASSGGELTGDRGRVAMENGMAIEDDDMLKVNDKSSAIVQFRDLTHVELGAGSVARFDQVRPKRNARGKSEISKRLHLKKGIARMEVIKQEKLAPTVVSTPFGRLSTEDARLILVCDDDFCYVEVRDGKVRLKANDQQRPLLIKTGQRVVIGPVSTDTAVASKVASIKDALPDRLNVQVAGFKSRLTLTNEMIAKLFETLERRKKADICLNQKQRRRKRYIF